jgi:hypothetical protein
MAWLGWSVGIVSTEGWSARGHEGIPQGLKPLFVWLIERPKAEALGYLEATGEARLKPWVTWK